MAQIELRKGDLFKSGADALVNTVNCVGVMGRGIALQFKKAYPQNFRQYKLACDEGEVEPGRMFVTETGKFSPKYIINFPTKRHWRGKSKIEDIEAGLRDLRSVLQSLPIASVAIPPLGSGLGGLDWNDVKARITSSLEDLDLNIILYEPYQAPEVVKSKAVPNMTEGRASLVALMNRYLSGLMDPYVTLLEVQKLMYFMQLAGQPLRLEYEKGPYGPYAPKLSHVLNRVEGHFISGYRDGGDQPFKELSIVPGAVSDAESFVSSKPDVKARLSSVANLVEGFETPFGLELLATAHWVATKEGALEAVDAIRRVHSWNDRKKGFTQRQIEIAFEALREGEWLSRTSMALN